MKPPSVRSATFVHDLASRLRCSKCAKAGGRPAATFTVDLAAAPSSNRSLTDVQSLLCRPLDYADHWLRTGSGGGDRCVGVGIIRLVSQRMVSFLPIEGRLSCRLICHELEFRVRFRPDLALSHRFASRQQRNRQSLSAVRDVPARLDYADVIAAVTATKARSPTLVGIIWKSA
jgi:hypothetical protein